MFRLYMRILLVSKLVRAIRQLIIQLQEIPDSNPIWNLNFKSFTTSAYEPYELGNHQQLVSLITNLAIQTR